VLVFHTAKCYILHFLVVKMLIIGSTELPDLLTLSLIMHVVFRNTFSSLFKRD